jgi:hypothetical protein
MQADTLDRADVLYRACGALTQGDTVTARGLIQTEYPFVSHANAGRAYTELAMMRVFLRDRFTDRYNGQRLIFPATLRLLSRLLPDEFPMHPSWKMS